MDKCTNSKPPFFVLGSVRSGTTMLRDVLRLHPNLECPEETHFFRWAHPYPTPHFLRPYERNPVLLKHRGIDGISEQEFQRLVEQSMSRKELAENYGRLYLHKRGNPDGRWFDKTPQNVYGILLISAMFPDARFIHIHRNPVDVVASLYRGKTLKIRSLPGAMNAWYESMCIISQFQHLHPDRLFEIPYAEFTGQPGASVARILEFVDEDPTLLKLPRNKVHPARTRNRKLLSQSTMDEISRRCEPFLSAYGYAQK